LCIYIVRFIAPQLAFCFLLGSEFGWPSPAFAHHGLIVLYRALLWCLGGDADEERAGNDWVDAKKTHAMIHP
jgi:hypothetical protein